MGGGVANTQSRTSGFTLAELLAVIAILGIIALIAFPAVNKVIKNSKEKAYAAQKEIILSSAKNWGIDNLNSLSEEEDTYLSIEELKQGGYLEKKQVINPKTDEEMTGCVIVSYSDEYNQYKYRYEEASCEEVHDVPIITLNGSKTMTINQGDTYTEPGATARYKDQDITSSIEITGTVDTSQVGTYTIRYNVIYNGKQAKEVIRTVKVESNDQPVDPSENITITLNPNKTEGYSKSLTVSVSTTGNINTLTYKLNNGEPQEVVDNQIILDQDGEYMIEVTATDDQGNTKSVTSETYYIDVTPPTITFEEGDTGLSISTSKVVDYDLKTGVIVEDNNTITLDNVTTSGTLSAQEGTYTITYTATDIAGNTATKTRTITVKKPTEILGEEVDEDQIMTNDPDENVRYVGPNPDNYVWFNSELWRIIGEFDGQAKIIRNVPYNTSIAWDKGSADGGIHGDNGWNDWSQATLKTDFNDTLLNTIDNISKKYIDTNYIWNLGGTPTEENANELTRDQYYLYERGTTVVAGRPTTWTGAIGLMYPSDYAYSTNSITNTCNTTGMGYWNNEPAKTECASKSWLYNSTLSQWTITPSNTVIGSSGIYIHRIDERGQVSSNYAALANGGSPVLYLKSNVKIASGSGTSTDPYILTQEVDQTKTPVIELQVPNNTFNANGWAKANFNVSITSNNSEESEIKEYKYCYGENCTPNTTSTTNIIPITTESASNYVCATATNQIGNTSEKVCGGPYKLDKTAPTLIVPGSASITSSQVSGYNLLTGASAIDNLSGVSGSITTSGSLSTTPKTYTITYRVTDKAGNVTAKTRNITVLGQTRWSFTSDGTFTVPDGVYSIYVTAIAGGGHGGSGGRYDDDSSTGNSSGGGGGGGGYAGERVIKKLVSVRPNEKISITIGGRGYPTQGGDTIFGTYFTLKGGKSGNSGSNGTMGGGSGGTGYENGEKGTPMSTDGTFTNTKGGKGGNGEGGMGEDGSRQADSIGGTGCIYYKDGTAGRGGNGYGGGGSGGGGGASKENNGHGGGEGKSGAVFIDLLP